MRARGLFITLAAGALLVVIPTFRLPTQNDPFLTGDRCVACHKGVTTSTGEDVSIGFDWRASMMANSARDPYWQAAVRREIIDHPDASAAIEDKCGRCHMPMANELERAVGRTGSIFANLPGGENGDRMAELATDGVSCALCHQVQPDGLGTEGSFTGGFHIEAGAGPEARSIFGPFDPDEGGVGIMRSATGYRPTEGAHMQSSELCASCHTLLTHALRDGGDEAQEFPEQVPYLEWKASRYAASGTECQTCHMPVVEEDVPVTAVLGRPRAEVSRHVFRGGNFFMLRMLNRYRDELGVVALPQELQLAASRTVEHLQEATAALSIEESGRSQGGLEFDVVVQNRAGHKFPTAYPSRRAWLHVLVTDAAGRAVFESGAFRTDGSIVGNDNDADGRRFEPHHDTIDDPSDVQVYEAVMVDEHGAVTTGLMEAERWIKDNRLLPEGFAPGDQETRIGVYGEARSDASFGAGGDRVRYRVATSGSGPHTIVVELWFQPIAYRWALNLADYDAFETSRFVRYYTSMAATSAIPLLRSSHVIP